MVRALPLQGRGRRFESYTAHQEKAPEKVSIFLLGSQAPSRYDIRVLYRPQFRKKNRFGHACRAVFLASLRFEQRSKLDRLGIEMGNFD